MPPIRFNRSHSARFSGVYLVLDQPPSDRARRVPILRDGRAVADHWVWFDAWGLNFETRVFDPRFSQPYQHADIWRGDCLQVGVDPVFERSAGRLGNAAVLLGFALVDGRPYVHGWKWADRPTGAVSVPFVFDRSPSGQVYRASLPWSDLLPGEPKGDVPPPSVGFSLSVNGQEEGQPRYDAWGAGIIGKQDASKFGVLIFDRMGVGVGAELISPNLPESVDGSATVELTLLIPSLTDRCEAVDVSVAVNQRPIARHRQSIQPGENRLEILLPAEALDDGGNQILVRVADAGDGRALLGKSVCVRRESVEASVARMLCERIDWSRPELANADFAAAYRAGRLEEAAVGFVCHLRGRSKPDLGYSKEYVAQLRQNAYGVFRDEAMTQVKALLKTPFLGGSYPDGRGTLLAVAPHVLQVGATRRDFDFFSQSLGENRSRWHLAATHTSVNVVRFLQAAWNLEECTDETLVPVLAFLADAVARQWPGARTWNDVSHGTTAHNWWIYELGGHWKAGFFFPELKGLARFQSFFPEFFEREIRLLFRPDGFTRECSASYHIGTTDIFLNIARIAARNGLALSDDFHRRLRSAGEVEWKMMQPDGNYPAFGDCFSAGPHLLERARSLAAILDIPESKFLAQTLAPDRPSALGNMLIEELNYPSVGEDLRHAYGRLTAARPSTLDTSLPDSGYYFMRQDWTGLADYAAIEASPRGMIDSSHGHSAIFDLKLCARGRAILVGNGKGPDDHGSPPRRWRVSTAAHSAADVDGQDPVPLKAIYRFDREVTPVVIDWISQSKFAFFHGVHEGFNRLPSPVAGAHRKLFYLRNRYWILIDRFVAASPDTPRVYRQHFQLGVPSTLQSDGRCATGGPGGNLLFVPVLATGSPIESERSDCPYPLDDHPWTQQLRYTLARPGHGLLITLMVPFLDDAMPDVSVSAMPVLADDRILSPIDATGLEIRIDGERHGFVSLHTHWNLPWESGGFKGDGFLFHSEAQA